MILQFPLPRGGVGIPATMYKNKLALQLRHWCLKNGTNYEHIESKDYIWTVSLAEEQDYAKFLLTFQWDGLWGKPKLIEEKG